MTGMNNSQKTFSPRIVIHGAGNVGRRLIRFCQLKGWDIVAVLNRAGDKVGMDIGELAELGTDIGVSVQDWELVDYQSLGADIALIATTSDMLDVNFPVYEKYLRAGINVLSHNTQAYNPRFENPSVAKKIDALAKSQGVSFTGSGIWDTTRLWAGIIAAGACVDVKEIVHFATAEIGRQGAQWEEDIGVGLTVEEFQKKYAKEPNSLSIFLHSPAVIVLQKIGCTVTNVHKSIEPVVFEQDVFSPFSERSFPAGIVVGTRLKIDVETEEGIFGRVRVEYRLFQDNEIEEISWKIVGMPGLEITVRRDDTANLSASSLFNRIPDVLSAPPGIVEIFRMGPLNSTALL
jgi:secondary-alkyl amine dehydrogenase [NAD(P)+]